MNDSARASSDLAVHTRGEGPPLVLYHGGMGSWNHWTRNLDALAAQYTVHAVDLPGYGGSPTISKTIAHDTYIDRVLEGINPLVGTQQFRLAGFSFGGVVAAMTAARLGDQVQRLSLLGVGGFGPVDNLSMQPIPAESAGDAARREAFRANLCTLMLADPNNVTEESIDFYAENFRLTRYDGRGMSMSKNVITALSRITCPVQFIYGDQDALVRHDLQRRAETVRGIRPNTVFVVVPGAGHWVAYEAAARVNQLLLDFFE